MKDIPEAKFHRDGFLLMASEIKLLDGLTKKIDSAGGGLRKDISRKSCVLRIVEQSVRQIVSVERYVAYMAVQQFSADSKWKPEIDAYVKRRLEALSKVDAGR